MTPQSKAIPRNPAPCPGCFPESPYPAVVSVIARVDFDAAFPLEPVLWPGSTQDLDSSCLGKSFFSTRL